jgi:hypothetical protein
MKALQTISQSMAHDSPTQQAELGPSRRKRFNGKDDTLVQHAVLRHMVSVGYSLFHGNLQGKYPKYGRAHISGDLQSRSYPHV